MAQSLPPSHEGNGEAGHFGTTIRTQFRQLHASRAMES